MKVLIIANARYKGGISGGDAIYENFVKHWACKCEVQTQMDREYKPFFLSYIHRIFEGCRVAMSDEREFDFVYSASDFLPDSLPALIYRLRGYKWVAGFYLTAFKYNKIHFLTQKFVKWTIKKWATMVIVTNPTMYSLFEDKPKTWINGGIDLSLARLGNEKREYDAVFCGRIHPTKGIDLLLQMWCLIRFEKPNARLALIGDGDLGIDWAKDFAKEVFGHEDHGIDFLGYMGEERYDVYRKSKMVFYPVPKQFDHFSMAPVEAMACGCPLIAFRTATTYFYFTKMEMEACALAVDPFAFVKFSLSLMEGEWEERVLETADWAKQFDYRKQSLRVFNDIREVLIDEDIHNRTSGHGRSSTLPKFV